ncbi:MAG: fructose-bisphosphatase class II, partial [Alphaproteobacteria bacterium]|nr:fructose-bisphosphatase class II [Alphaproteobacteria bacterium]
LPAAEKIALLSRKLKKPVADISVFVLDKPRHRELVDQIRGAGARVVLYPAGDIAGAVMAATPGSGIDAMMGTGGTAEGMLAACAIRAMGAEFQGRIDPQLETEKRAVLAAGMDTTRWHSVDELIASDQVFFCATGITPGLLLGGVERTRTQERTETLMISGPDGERQLLTTHHHKGGA